MHGQDALEARLGELSPKGVSMLKRLRRSLQGLRDAHVRERELERARTRVSELERENQRIRSAMRRCLSCDYRPAADRPEQARPH
ncbi:MAG: hypothetical protein CL938_17855 [Deltaproteobacteria bacterium]|nr:hypothetical protein [Deltaproteobacteria bacterium]